MKEFLAAEACTAWGYERCLDLEPESEPAVIEILLDEAAEGLSLLQARSVLALEDLPDLREILPRLEAGAALSGGELLAIKTVLVRSRKSKSSISLLEQTIFPRLTALLPTLFCPEGLVTDIDAAISPAGEVRDDASPLLSSLRKDIKRIENQIKDELTRIIHSSTLSKALQEPLFTQRSNRYVLPVTASHRHSIEGIVHDSSASGLTIYVEPKAVVEMSNTVRLKEVEIEREIQRILLDLSSKARLHSDEISNSFETLVELDFIMARARLAAKYGGFRPEISKENILQLKSAKHPLLILQHPERASQIVPNDITLGGNNRTMVVTGPNTGGKTVLLKTAGLLSFMVKSGLLIPAAPGSKAVIFSDIFADIGDEQSLSQSLSTFSSHMTNIVEIINRANAQTLVLLDEIGAGTDPREGAALARSVLEFLNDAGTKTISTTHYGELKTLAYTQPGFINASLDFDETALSPTYRLRTGVPGSSKATTIAQRLGLKSSVIEKATLYLDSNAKDIQKLTEELEARLNALAKEEESAKSATLSAAALEAKARAELADLDAERELLRRTLAGEIEEDFKRVREQIRALIANLQKQPSMQTVQQAQKEMEKIKQDLNWLNPKESGKQFIKVSVGQTVRIKSLNKIGLVEAVPADDREGQPDGMISVRAGNMKVKVQAGDLELVSDFASKQASDRNVARSKSGGTPSRSPGTRQTEVSSGPIVFVRTTSNTIDLRGKRVDAALSEVERFLDDAYLSSRSPLMIIHGHGTGAVKAVVRQYLSESSYPNTFRPGELYEGGDGVTVVDLQ